MYALIMKVNENLDSTDSVPVSGTLGTNGLTKQGWDFRRGCRCIWSPDSPTSPLVCGLKILLSMKCRYNRSNCRMNVIDSLENIGKTVRNIHCMGKCVLDVIIFNTDNNYSGRFKLQLLKRLINVCEFDLNMLPEGQISIYDFFVPGEMVESGMFCLFQAGASTEFIGSFSEEFQKRTQHQYRSQIYPDYSYNSNLCRALVSDRENNNFQAICSSQISTDMKSIRSLLQSADHTNALHRSPVFEQLIREFLEWYRVTTSSPFTLQFQCRTVIRKTLILATGHRSILKRIAMLHLPEKLKKFLIYE